MSRTTRPFDTASRPIRALLLLVAGALVLSACGDNGGDDDAGDADAEIETDTGDDADADEEAEGEAAGDGEPLHIEISVERGSEVVTGVDAVPDMVNMFANNLEEELPNVEIDRFYSLGDEFAQMELVRAGEVDVVPIGSDIVQLDDKFEIFDMPFLLRDRATAIEALDGPVGDQLAESLLETNGLRVLSYGEIGIRHITNNVRPIETPEDLNGIQLRTPGSETRVMSFEMLGATPTPMSLDETYLALDQGVLDGQENPFGNIDGRSFYEVQDYLSLTGHVYTPVVLVVNEDRWQGLSAEQQDAFQAAADAAAEQSRADGERNDDELREKFEEYMEINEVDIEAFQEAAVPIWDAIDERIGEGFVDEVLSELGLSR